MKRNAAIIGPTPAFLRWAINLPCPLREIESDNLPSSTFRQLRSLSEWSTASREGRVMDGVAFHPDTRKEGALLGFPVDEIADAFGGTDFVQSSCGGCPANSLKDVEGCAGCFGIVKIVDQAEIVQQVERAVSARELYSQLRQVFPLGAESEFEAESESRSSPAALWYGLWINRVITPAAAGVLLPLVENLRNRSAEWESFCISVQQCYAHNLELHVELYPRGVSDGRHWRLDPHCANCKALWNDETLWNDEGDGRRGNQAGKACQVCGKQWVERAEKKRKVLGIRPYMRLEHIFGNEKCEALRERYLARAQSDSVDGQ